MAKRRHYFFVTLLKFVNVCARKKIRLIIENPWNVSGETYLQKIFYDQRSLIKTER